LRKIGLAVFAKPQSKLELLIMPKDDHNFTTNKHYF
jgi:hypothetical protein